MKSVITSYSIHYTKLYDAVVAGVYATTHEAQEKMGGGFETEYHPIPENAAKYQVIYEKYMKLGKFIEENLTR